jgi:transcriptional regulator with XRE-family HTH domain
MNGDQRTRLAAKRAVVALRNALDLTQQKFAGISNTAVTTIARYETSHPPSGKVLLRLAEIAQENGLLDLSIQFRLIYLEEVLGDEYWSTANLSWWSPGEMGPNPYGYLVVKLSGDEEIERAKKAHNILIQPSREGARKPKSQRVRRNQ